jgi:hypothetical protein
MAKPEILTINFARGDDVLKILPRPASQLVLNAGRGSIYVEEHYSLLLVNRE